MDKKLDVVFQRNFAQADNYTTEIIPKANVFYGRKTRNLTLPFGHPIALDKLVLIVSLIIFIFHEINKQFLA